MLVLAITLTQPVAAQSFTPDFYACNDAYKQKDRATALGHIRPLPAPDFHYRPRPPSPTTTNGAQNMGWA